MCGLRSPRADNTLVVAVAFCDTLLPCDDSAMFDHCPIIPKIWLGSEYNLDAVTVKVQHCGIEMPVLVGSRRRRAIGTTSSGQGIGVKVPNGSSTRRCEGDMCSSGFYTITIVNVNIPNSMRMFLPWCFLA